MATSNLGDIECQGCSYLRIHDRPSMLEIPLRDSGRKCSNAVQQQAGGASKLTIKRMHACLATAMDSPRVTVSGHQAAWPPGRGPGGAAPQTPLSRILSLQRHRRWCMPFYSDAMISATSNVAFGNAYTSVQANNINRCCSECSEAKDHVYSVIVFCCSCCALYEAVAGSVYMTYP
jgi:hypothetical protein